MNFKNWLKNNLEVEPNKKIDQNIIIEAQSLLLNSEKRKYSNFKPITLTVFSVLIIFSFFIIEQRNNQNHLSQINHKTLEDESIEMLMNYNQIELMAEASNLDENDWNKIK